MPVNMSFMCDATDSRFQWGGTVDAPGGNVFQGNLNAPAGNIKLTLNSFVPAASSFVISFQASTQSLQTIAAALQPLLQGFQLSLRNLSCGNIPTDQQEILSAIVQTCCGIFSELESVKDLYEALDLQQISGAEVQEVYEQVTDILTRIYAQTDKVQNLNIAISTQKAMRDILATQFPSNDQESIQSFRTAESQTPAERAAFHQFIANLQTQLGLTREQLISNYQIALPILREYFSPEALSIDPQEDAAFSSNMTLDGGCEEDLQGAEDENLKTRIESNGSPPGGVADKSQMSDLERKLILVFDSGGVRSISSLLILQAIMEYVVAFATPNEVLRSDVALPAGCFDVISGSGSGGLFAILLGRLRFEIRHVYEGYIEFGNRIYKQPPTSAFRFLSTRVSNKVLTEAIAELLHCHPASREHFYDMRMNSKLRCETIIPLAPLRDGQFSQIDTQDLFSTFTSRHLELKLIDIARATVASPTRFEPVMVGGVRYIDGSLFNTDPCYSVTSEPDPYFSSALVVSIGAGTFKSLWSKRPQKPRISFSKYSGLLAALRENAADASNVATRMKQVAARSLVQRQRRAGIASEVYGMVYRRFNVGEALAKVSFDDWSEMEYVVDSTQAYLRREDVVEELKEVAQLIVDQREIRLRSAQNV